MQKFYMRVKLSNLKRRRRNDRVDFEEVEDCLHQVLLLLVNLN